MVFPTGKPPEDQQADGAATAFSNKIVTFENLNNNSSPRIRLNSVGGKSAENPNPSEWKTVQGKRGRESPSKTNQMKQAKLDSYWLSDPNRYSILQNDEVDDNVKIVTPEKPPPIFVDRVENVKPLLDLLNSSNKIEYEMKSLSLDRIKIQTFNPESFSEVIKLLEAKKTEFYTYKLKSERNFKVILKNIHPTFDQTDITDALLEHGHVVKNIHNIKQYQTQRALPMFVIEIEPKESNKDIYKIKSLLHCRVIFEPPRTKKHIPQCANCQQYGHTKSFCHRIPKCIKCAGNHSSKDCQQKLPSNELKCTLCNGNHPANYKGCSVYQQIKLQKFPPQRQQKLPVPSAKEPKSQLSTNVNGWQNQKSYAEAVRNGNGSEESQTSSTTDSLLKEIKGMMSMMREMMSQITAMTNLLINLIPKPTPCP